MSGSIFHPFVLDNTAGQETIVGIGSDSEKYGVGISSHVHVTGIGTFSDLLHTTGIIHAVGGIKDTSGNIGSSGKVLSSTGSGLQWIDPSEGSTANAVNVGTNLNSTNADQFVAFMGTSSGNNPVRVDAGIKYNPSSNLLTVGSISGSIAASNVNSGTLGVDRIPSLPASKITSGQLDAARIPTLNQNTTGNAATATSATTAGTVTTAAQTNITSLGTLTGLTVDGNITQSGTSNYIRINGALQDKDGQDGDSGQVLSSTGNQINWINVGDISAGSASQIAVSDESSDTTCFPLFVNAATGNQSPKSGTNLTFNSSTGALSATSFSGSIAASNINSGTLGTDRIPSLAASKITSGTLGTDRIPNLAASKITSGTLGTARIPNLAASKITSGTLGTDRIPSLAASKITSGQFDTARIPTLNQNTTGTSGGLSGSPSITVTNITIDGQLRDGDNAFGSSGQVLSSDGTDTKWINAGSLSAGAAAQVAVNATNTTNSSHFIAFTETSSGNEEIRVDNSLTYNPSTNVLTAGTFSGSVAASNVDSGTLGTARIPNLAASKITSGTLGVDRIPDLAASKITSGTLGTGRIPDLAASKITSGTLGTDRIPNLASSKITSGTLGTDRIPNLAASKITSGTLGTARIPNLDASKITSGTISDDRLPATISSNITGSAATLTNSRSIAGTSFNGSANIDINYNNLTNKPTIPTNNNQLTNGAGYITAANAFPSGGIIIWSGAANAIPTGWVLCDGNNSTPDLRNRFVIGSGAGSSYPVNQTGGSADATLVSHSHTINNHTHSFSGSGSSSHSHGIPKGRGGSQASIQNYVPTPKVEQVQASFSSDSATVSVSISGTTGNPSDSGTNTQGSSATNANLPPYYALCYIMKT